MKPRNLHKIAFALFALLLAASCDKEEFAGRPADDGQPQPIRFDIAMATATATPSGVSTRVTTATDYTSTFTAGDRVGLYIVKGNAGLQPSDNWVDNALLTYDGEKWTCDLPEGKEYFPHDGSQLSFYAYYPYKAQLADSLVIEFTVPSDQSTDSGFASAYLMTASETYVSRRHDPVSLWFSHQLALVRVKLIDGDEPKDIAPGRADVVTLKGRKLRTRLSLPDNDGGYVWGAATDVKMHYNTDDRCWYALVPRQTVTAGSGLLTFEWTGITTLNHKTGQDFHLLAGAVNQLDITIDAKIDPNHVYAVGDAYPYAGFEKKGVVFEVSNGGKSGKIISLKREYGLYWSTDTSYVTKANNKLNGRVNMATLRTMDPLYPERFDECQAFKWGAHCLNPENTTYAADSKGLWYLPADEELKPMYAADNKEKVSRRLKALGLENPFPENNTYIWSSTEEDLSNPKQKAHAMRLSDGTIFTFDKNEGSLYTWPILAF